MDEIKRIFIGLPNDIIGKILWIADNYRINPLSRTPGGNDVVIEYTNGKIYAYDRVKFPSLYINKIFITYISDQYSSFENLERIKQIEIVKTEVKRLFVRNYNSNVGYETNSFEEVWDSSESNNLPWESLKEFENKNNGTITL